MELDTGGAGGDHRVVARSTGDLERGDNDEPGKKTATAHGGRIGATGWNQPSRTDRSADSLALWHGHRCECEAARARRSLIKDSRRSGFQDSRNGATEQLRRNRDSSESHGPAERLWSAVHDAAR